MSCLELKHFDGDVKKVSNLLLLSCDKLGKVYGTSSESAIFKVNLRHDMYSAFGFIMTDNHGKCDEKR